MNPLYEMKLGDCLYDSQCHRNYVRVPGGWVVESGNATDVTSSCFVPFHNEFMECSEQGEPSFNSPASPAQHAQAEISLAVDRYDAMSEFDFLSWVRSRLPKWRKLSAVR